MLSLQINIKEFMRLPIAMISCHDLLGADKLSVDYLRYFVTAPFTELLAK
jgi:hypothetical protein